MFTQRLNLSINAFNLLVIVSLIHIRPYCPKNTFFFFNEHTCFLGCKEIKKPILVEQISFAFVVVVN